MIKLADTKEKQQLCFDYLKEKGTLALSDLFFYFENEKGEIKAVAGILLCSGINSKIGMVEPFQQDCNLSAMRLYDYCEGYLKGMGCTHIILQCKEDSKRDNIYGRLGFQCITDLKQYFKEI